MQFNYFLNKINNLDDFYKYINSWVFINYEEILQIILYIYAYIFCIGNINMQLYFSLYYYIEKENLNHKNCKRSYIDESEMNCVKKKK